MAISAMKVCCGGEDPFLMPRSLNGWSENERQVLDYSGNAHAKGAKLLGEA